MTSIIEYKPYQNYDSIYTFVVKNVVNVTFELNVKHNLETGFLYFNSHLGLIQYKDVILLGIPIIKIR